ncbi:MAG TPA: hypothetical protein VMV46_00435 [Thermoanaerobaculia bacterium]|nr:hypothetical protein [Thermoanaerobaculia bacterium]
MSLRNRWSFLLFLTVAGLLAGVTPPTFPSDLPPLDLPPLWRGADGAPLPFASDDQLLDYLENAEVVARKVLARGVNGTVKVTLERDGVRAHAAFRTVALERASRPALREPDRYLFRDHYGFEVAAYRLSRLLGLELVPPTVLRTIDGRPGSLQLWVEDAFTEADAIVAKQPVFGAARHLQRQVLKVFDALIYNFDRHQNNLLYANDGRIWAIDHTRSFKRLPEIADRRAIYLCERALYHQLRALDRDTLERELGDLLHFTEIDALLRRRSQLLKLLDRRIAELGETRVLFDGVVPVRMGREIATAGGKAASATGG